MSKQQQMETVVAEVNSCQKCGLWRTRRNAVPGEGSIDAVVLFVGEAPGYWEDMKARPFVGSAGKLLDELLLKTRLPRGSVYITNVVKCRPPENRDPSPVEIETCTPYLDRQIMLIQPKVIVTLGRHSANYILSKAGFKGVESITRVHGKVHQIRLFNLSVSVIPTYHPAAALYNPKYRHELERDFELLRAELDALGHR